MALFPSAGVTLLWTLLGSSTFPALLSPAQAGTLTCTEFSRRLLATSPGLSLAKAVRI